MRYGFAVTRREIPIALPTGRANGTVEFAEHRSAPRGNAGAGFTFDILWTPPPTDVGDVVFYFAGNAADGNGANSNDHIYTAAQVISPVCGFTSKATLRSFVNGASFLAPWAGNGMMSIFGSGFQPAGRMRSTVDADLAGARLPKQLSCVAVEVAGQRVPITYLQPDQINIQAPTLLQNSGPVSVVVILNAGGKNELRSDTLTNTGLQAVAPAFFTFNGKGIAAQFAGSTGLVADPSVAAGSRPAKPGDLVTLYGTGFGYTDPVWQAGEVPNKAASITTPFTLNIGGIPVSAADVTYAGLSPGSISGLYQFNVRIPTVAADGDLPVSLTIGGVSTQPGATIPVPSRK